MSINRASRLSASRGSALVMAMFALVLLTGLGLALLSLGETEIEMSRAAVRSKQAFYLAEAGLEHARLALYATYGSRPFDDALEAAAGFDGEIQFDPELLTRSYGARGVPPGLAGFGDDLAVTGPTAIELSEGVSGWYAAFLDNDPTESGVLTDSNDLVMLTGVGMGPGNSFEIVQSIIEYQELTPPVPPATITIPGPPPEFDAGESAAMAYSGNDCDGKGDPDIHVPTVGVLNPEAREPVVEDIRRDKIYNSGDYSGAETIVDLTDASNPLVTSEVGPIWTDCMEMRQLMSRLRDAANIICTTDECELPPPGEPQIIYVDGDFSGPDGEGLLAVSGVLRVGINWDWSGLILVIGKGEVRRMGGGNGEISGAMVIANIAGPDRLLFTDDDCSQEPDGFEAATYDTEGGGNSLVTYCLSALQEIRISLPYKAFGFRQL